jgi:hypothetical protein
MRSLRGVSFALASFMASIIATSSAVAQAPGSGTVLHVEPYAGYMVFGNYLSGPLGTSLSNAPGPIYGTQVNLSLAPRLSLFGNIGYTASDIKVGIPILGGVSVGHSSMLIYDGGLELNLGPMGEHGGLPIEPFIQAGVGAIRYNIDETVINTQATNFAGNVGIGADYTIARGIALRFLAKDYVGKFNFQDATGLGISGNTAHNLAFSAGLRFDF